MKEINEELVELIVEHVNGVVEELIFEHGCDIYVMGFHFQEEFKPPKFVFNLLSSLPELPKPEGDRFSPYSLKFNLDVQQYCKLKWNPSEFNTVEFESDVYARLQEILSDMSGDDMFGSSMADRWQGVERTFLCVMDKLLEPPNRTVYRENIVFYLCLEGEKTWQILERIKETNPESMLKTTVQEFRVFILCVRTSSGEKAVRDLLEFSGRRVLTMESQKFLSQVLLEVKNGKRLAPLVVEQKLIRKLSFLVLDKSIKDIPKWWVGLDYAVGSVFNPQVIEGNLVPIKLADLSSDIYKDLVSKSKYRLTLTGVDESYLLDLKTNEKTFNKRSLTYKRQKTRDLKSKFVSIIKKMMCKCIENSAQNIYAVGVHINSPFELPKIVFNTNGSLPNRPLSDVRSIQNYCKAKWEVSNFSSLEYSLADSGLLQELLNQISWHEAFGGDVEERWKFVLNTLEDAFALIAKDPEFTFLGVSSLLYFTCEGESWSERLERSKRFNSKVKIDQVEHEFECLIYGDAFEQGEQALREFSKYSTEKYYMSENANPLWPIISETKLVDPSRSLIVEYADVNSLYLLVLDEEYSDVVSWWENAEKVRLFFHGLQFLPGKMLTFSLRENEGINDEALGNINRYRLNLSDVDSSYLLDTKHNKRLYNKKSVNYKTIGA